MFLNNQQALWFLLAIPVLVIVSLLTGHFINRARRRFADQELYTALTRSTSKRKRIVRTVAFYLGLAFLVLAMAEPRFGMKTEIVRRRGIDIVVALDTSISMLAEDVKPNRIRQARLEIHKLIDNLRGDRIALLGFAGRSFVHCPLTNDYGAAKTLLDNIDVGIIPVPGTDMEEAIRGSMRLINEGSSGLTRIIVLFTDGENHSGDPLRAARDAASHEIQIFTVGIGTQSGEVIPIRDENGELEEYKKDREGNVVTTSLNEETLRDIAEIADGEYLRSDSGEVNLETFIEYVGSIDRKQIYETRISRLRERYQIPLGISLVLLFVWLGVSNRKSKVKP